MFCCRCKKIRATIKQNKEILKNNPFAKVKVIKKETPDFMKKVKVIREKVNEDRERGKGILLIEEEDEEFEDEAESVF
jgi:uncharacterized protein YoxC